MRILWYISGRTSHSSSVQEPRLAVASGSPIGRADLGNGELHLF